MADYNETLSESIAVASAVQGAAWLPYWYRRVKIDLPSAPLTEDQTDYPLLIHLSDSAGTGSRDLSCVFNELGTSGAYRKRLAITTEDGLTECYWVVLDWRPTVYAGSDTRKTMVSHSSRDTSSVPGEKAFDGLATSQWRSDQNDIPDPGGSCYLEWDFGAALDVSEVRLHSTSDTQYNDFPEDIKIYGSATGAFGGEEALLGAITFDNPGIDAWTSWFEISSHAAYRYVRVEFHSEVQLGTDADNRVRIAEVEFREPTGEARILVKVPTVYANKTTALYLYYDAARMDNEDYGGDPGDAICANVFDADYESFWTFGETFSDGVTGIPDLSGGGHTTDPIEGTVPDYREKFSNDLGPCFEFVRGDGNYAEFPATLGCLVGAVDFTVTMLFNIRGISFYYQHCAFLDARGEAAFDIRTTDDSPPKMALRANGGEKIVWELNVEQDYLIHVVHTAAGGFSLYVDGDLDTAPEGTTSVDANTTYAQNTIGRNQGTPTNMISAYMYELSVASAERSASWIKLDHLARTDALLTFHAEEEWYGTEYLVETAEDIRVIESVSSNVESTVGVSESIAVEDEASHSIAVSKDMDDETMVMLEVMAVSVTYAVYAPVHAAFSVACPAIEASVACPSTHFSVACPGVVFSVRAP